MTRNDATTARPSAGATAAREQSVLIPVGAVQLEGSLTVPEQARGVVLFAHGSGSSRLSPRNRFVAQVLVEAGLATLLMDLLTAEEERLDRQTAHLRFDIGLLAARLLGATDWLRSQPPTQALGLGYFGASTGAAAALAAAAQRPEDVRAIVSRGGRPDLAREALALVRAPTLLIVGGNDTPVLEMNREVMRLMAAETQLHVVPGATHLFEEPGALEEVARLARDWFLGHLS